ncbi:unnamed protein product [Cyprideis torosa]|uniref:Leucine-rich repeat-containing protein 20 n=1 Tax=Cyprideis torosa TaxID=163714 RepID=A0A7R8W841_9CRUS|nr:unnamed protein product [Cyprideis torosa]CAG0883399.1 unnamed protein product [Cyprideis torosa]
MHPEEVVGISEAEQAANARRMICAKLAGNAVTRVVHRCSDAKLTTHLALNLSFNNIGSLPDELSLCTDLQRLDISNNSFTYLPKVLFRLPSLRVLHAKKNYIADIEVEKFCSRPRIVELDFTENPVNTSSRALVAKLPEGRKLTIHLSPQEDSDSDFE